MPAAIPAESEVLGYFQRLSNWGRWGADDELGTPNLITPEKNPPRPGHRAGRNYRLPGPHRPFRA